jgi:hypothetical protein
MAEVVRLLISTASVAPLDDAQPIAFFAFFSTQRGLNAVKKPRRPRVNVILLIAVQVRRKGHHQSHPQAYLRLIIRLADERVKVLSRV